MSTVLGDRNQRPASGRDSGVRSMHIAQQVSYAEILLDVFDALVASDSWVTDRSRREAAQRLGEMTAQVRDCGSGCVLGAFLRLCEATDAYGSAPSLYKLADQCHALERFLLAMRVNLGGVVAGLEHDGDLAFFVSDVGEYLAQSGITDCPS